MNTELKSLVKLVLEWWEEHQYDCRYHGDGEEYNIYDEEPAFVTLAKTIREKEKKRQK